MSSISSVSQSQFSTTNMYQESKSASELVGRQLQTNGLIIEEAVARIKQFKPRAVVTLARGSSDCAAVYGKYLIESQLGLITASASPGMSSVYGVGADLRQTLFIAISQSGASPDLLASAQRAKAAGALVLSLVNVEDSPLAALADIVIPIKVDKEVSVAATKSFIATLSALAQLVSIWSQKAELIDAVNKLPQQLQQAWACDWTQQGIDAFKDTRNMFVIGRGYGFGIALEAALKLKETCGIHAEGYSAAEVKHGPMAIVNQGFPVLFVGQNDETRKSMLELVLEFQSRGANVLFAAEESIANLPVVPGAYPMIAPLLSIQSFYRMANGLALIRGFNPDEPPHLKKVTETL